MDELYVLSKKINTLTKINTAIIYLCLRVLLWFLLGIFADLFCGLWQNDIASKDIINVISYGGFWAFSVGFIGGLIALLNKK